MIRASAYVLRESGVVPKLEEIKVNGDLQVGQVLVRVIYSSLCATQLEEIFVSSRNLRYMPHLLGHEGVGFVEAIGPGVTSKQIGDACIVHWRKSSRGLDAVPGEYWIDDQIINAGPVALFGEYAVVPENRLTQIPAEQVSPETSLLGCAFPTGWGSLKRVGQLGESDSVLIIGLGGVGESAALAATSIQNAQLSIYDANPRRMAKIDSRLGAEKLFELSEATFRRINPSLIVETTGSPKIIGNLVDWASPGSRIVLVGMPKLGVKAQINIQKLLDGVKILGSNGGDIDFARDFAEMFQDFGASLRREHPSTVEVFPASNLESAIEAHWEGENWRCVLNFK